jgi:hypothetical protein
MDELAGLVLTTLSGWPARIAGQDLPLRRKAENLMSELRTELANAALERGKRDGDLSELAECLINERDGLIEMLMQTAVAREVTL